MGFNAAEGGFGERRATDLEKETVRYYDQKSGLWYVIRWDDTLKCYVTQLESGQHSVIAVNE